MINITSQQSQVDYHYVRKQQLETRVVADKDLVSAASSEQQTNIAFSLSKEEVQLTPDQVVKQRLIESISPSSANKTDEDEDALTNLYEALSRRNTAAEQSPLLIPLSILDDVPDNILVSVSEYLYENEALDYATSLSFTNVQGEQISASLALRIERELEIERQFIAAAGELKDPLIINLEGRAALFSDGVTEFDVDSDGHKDTVPELNKGVYFLALDRDQDGLIGNSSELFGAVTGDGFSELRAYDDDHNGLIDQRDGAFQDLQLWDGRQGLQGLAQSGIAAISLAARSTPFTFTDELGNARAQLRQTSVFIRDDNTLGAAHQVDFVV